MSTTLQSCNDCGHPFLDFASGWFFALEWAARVFPGLPDDIRDGKVQDRMLRLFSASRLVHDHHLPPTAGHVCRPKWMVRSEARYGCLDAVRIADPLPIPHPQVENDGKHEPGDTTLWAPYTPPFQERLERGFSRLEWTTSALVCLDMDRVHRLEQAKARPSREHWERVYGVARAVLEEARDKQSAFEVLVDNVDHALVWQAMKFLEPNRWSLYLDIDDRVPNNLDVASRGGRAVDYQELHAPSRVLCRARDAVLRALEQSA
jgi:hypothetical protein